MRGTSSAGGLASSALATPRAPLTPSGNVGLRSCPSGAGTPALTGGGGFRRLQDYVEQHGDAHVRGSYAVDGYRLGTWVVYQRTLYLDGALDTQLVRRLEALPGWTWDPRADQWENGFSRLLRYLECHGNAGVPQSYRDDEGYRLGGWVLEQRASYAKGAIDAERQRRLEELPGWTWNASGKRGTQR